MGFWTRPTGGWVDTPKTHAMYTGTRTQHPVGPPLPQPGLSRMLVLPRDKRLVKIEDVPDGSDLVALVKRFPAPMCTHCDLPQCENGIGSAVWRSVNPSNQEPRAGRLP